MFYVSVLLPLLMSCFYLKVLNGLQTPTVWPPLTAGTETGESGSPRTLKMFCFFFAHGINTVIKTVLNFKLIKTLNAFLINTVCSPTFLTKRFTKKTVIKYRGLHTLVR